MTAESLMTEEEFDELDSFLLSEQCSDETMTMDALSIFFLLAASLWLS